jgi:hypothetical protein
MRLLSGEDTDVKASGASAASVPQLERLDAVADKAGNKPKFAPGSAREFRGTSVTDDPHG